MSGGPTLTGERVVIRPHIPADRAPLAAHLAHPSVSRWWGPGGPEHALEDWLDEEDSVVLVIEIDGVVAGSIQYGEETDPDYRHATIDLFLGGDYQDRGIGSEAIRLVARYLFDVRSHHRLTIDPSAANERAIRAYERVGFRRVGIMRSYERGADGTWHDGLLLDLLSGELA